MSRTRLSDRVLPGMQMPSEWEIPRPGFVAGVVTLATIIVLLVPGGIWLFVVKGDWLGILVVAASVLILACLPYNACRAVMPPRRSGQRISLRSFGSDGSVSFLAYSVAVSQFRYFMYFALAGFFAGASVILRVGQFSRLSPRSEGAFTLLAEVGPYLVLTVIPHLASYLWRRGRSLGIGLTKDGVIHSSWFGSCFFRWEFIRSVEAAMTRGEAAVVLVGAGRSPIRGREKGESLLARVVLFRESMARIWVGHMAQHPALVLHAIRYYHEHPEARAELGTERSVERIRSADFGGFVTDATPDHSLTDPPDRPGRGWGQT